MSYDLHILPREKRKTLPSYKEVKHFLANLKSPALTVSADETFQFKEKDGCEVFVYINTSEQSPFVDLIEVCSSYGQNSTGMSKLCAQIAERFHWMIYDPQGGDWYSSTEFLTSENETLDLEGISLIASILGGILFLGSGLGYYISVKIVGSAEVKWLLWPTLAGLLIGVTGFLCAATLEQFEKLRSWFQKRKI